MIVTMTVLGKFRPFGIDSAILNSPIPQEVSARPLLPPSFSRYITLIDEKQTEITIENQCSVEINQWASNVELLLCCLQSRRVPVLFTMGKCKSNVVIMFAENQATTNLSQTPDFMGCRCLICDSRWKISWCHAVVLRMVGKENMVIYVHQKLLHKIFKRTHK